MNRKLDEANERLQLLEATNLTLEFKVKSSEASDGKLKDTIQFMEDHVSQLEKDKEKIELEFGKEISELKGAKKTLEKQVSENKEIIENYEEKIRETEVLLVSKKAEFEEKISCLTTEKNRFSEKNEELSEKVDDFSVKIDEFESHIQSLEKQLELKNTLFKSSQADLTSLEEVHSKTVKLLEENTLLTESLKSELQERKKKQYILNSTIEDLTAKLSDYESQIESLKIQVNDMEQQYKILYDENISLNDFNQKIRVHDTENSDFEKDLEKSIEEHSKRLLTSNTIIVVKVVLYDTQTWCLVSVKSQHPTYVWYEKHLLEEITPELACPEPSELELERKIKMLTNSSLELARIQEVPFPSELVSDALVEKIEELVRAYEKSRKATIKPIKVFEFDPELQAVQVSDIGSPQFSGVPDHTSESLVTAEEANQIFKKMKDLEEENMELENRIMLLTQQLLYFKNEGKTSQFGGASDPTVEHVRSITVSLFEKLPMQTGDVESNIKILLDIMGMQKDAQDKLMERRGIKTSPAKQPSGFKKLFSKKK